jgi:hypothetical protein
MDSPLSQAQKYTLALKSVPLIFYGLFVTLLLDTTYNQAWSKASTTLAALTPNVAVAYPPSKMSSVGNPS